MKYSIRFEVEGTVHYLYTDNQATAQLAAMTLYFSNAKIDNPPKIFSGDKEIAW